MPNPFQTAAFKKLQTHWYQKLKESGFNDIELEDADKGGSMFPQNWNARRLQSCEGGDLPDLRREYFSIANQFLESFDFETQLHRRIWTFHAHGFSIRQIGKLVGKDKDHVHGVVRRLKTAMLGRDVVSMKGLRAKKNGKD